MSLQKFTARVSETGHITDKYVYLHAELIDPHKLTFQAGQYITLEVPGSDQKKNYSIASSPDMDHAIELLVDISPGGLGTTYINGLKPGDPISFYAPVGQFTMPDATSKVCVDELALVFVATGSGITPLRSMILDQLRNKHDTRKMLLYWGMRHEQDLYWLEDFHELEKSFPNFQLHPVLSKAGDEWPLCRGRVTDCLSIHPMVDSAGYYICGNQKMILDVQSFLLQKNVEQEHIHFEKFY